MSKRDRTGQGSEPAPAIDVPAADSAAGTTAPEAVVHTAPTVTDRLAAARAARSKGGSKPRVTRYYVIGVLPDGRHDLLSEQRSARGAQKYVETVGPAIGRHYARIGVIRGRDVTDRVLGAASPDDRSDVP